MPYPHISRWSIPIGRSSRNESISSTASDPHHARPHNNLPASISSSRVIHNSTSARVSVDPHAQHRPRNKRASLAAAGAPHRRRTYHHIAAASRTTASSHGRRRLHRLRPRRRHPGPPASLLYQLHDGWPGVSEEPLDDEEPGEERQDHLHDVPAGLAAEGPERDRVRAHRVAGAVEHPAHQRQQPHGALLLQHRRGARPLPLAPGAHLPVLAVVGDVALGSVHRAHLWPDRVQGQDRGLLPEVVA